MEPEKTEKTEKPRIEYLKVAPLYHAIKLLFLANNRVFYNTVQVTGIENVPPEGVATVLAFNHGNGLTDSTLLMEATMGRQVRFCAKDSLWSIPVFGQLVKYSGAIPVYRPKEHGAKAQEYNEEMYRNAFEALHAGEALAIAPEGVSRFAPNLAQPLKTGPARIALRAMELAMRGGEEGGITTKQKPFEIHIVPVGITYTHREKFRSSVAVTYGSAIVVNEAFMRKYHHTQTSSSFSLSEEESRAASRDITERINASLKTLTLHSPDFRTTKLAMTATRVSIPLGTKLTLKEYFDVMRAWISVLETHAGKDAQVAALAEALDEYQSLLDEKRVKDERVLRRMRRGRPASRVPTFFLILFRLILCVALFAAVAPGLALWAPFALIVRKRERQILAKGRNWNDSVTEMKMFWGTMFVVAAALVAGRYAPLVELFLFLTVRLYEELVASTRSLYTHFKFAFLTKATLMRMMDGRKRTAALLKSVAEKYVDPASLPPPIEISHIGEFDAAPLRSSIWENLDIRRRKKKDWNEVLRVHDANTMDYF